MEANVKTLVIVNIHTILLKDNIFSFLCSIISFILRKIINRVKFVYLFKLYCVI